MTLLSVENLTVTIPTPEGPLRAVRNLSFSLDRGEVLGIVGESGCGKSMTGLALIGLLPKGVETSGKVNFHDQDLLGLDEDEMCKVRGNAIAMVFQEPMTSLNPVHPIGRQIVEPLILHHGLSKKGAASEAIRLLDRVGVPGAGDRVNSYPHEMSGGQQQRVMIAIAISCAPAILVADEPTTALDVTTQQQILDLLADLVEEQGMGMVLISHDLGVIGERADQVLVMYGGAAVERGPANSLFRRLAHPYTQGLFTAMPSLGRSVTQRLRTIRGTVPDLTSLPAGCTFADRCPLVVDACRERQPHLQLVAPSHFAACIRLDTALKDSPV